MTDYVELTKNVCAKECRMTWSLDGRPQSHPTRVVFADAIISTDESSSSMESIEPINYKNHIYEAPAQYGPTNNLRVEGDKIRQQWAKRASPKIIYKVFKDSDQSSLSSAGTDEETSLGESNQPAKTSAPTSIFLQSSRLPSQHDENEYYDEERSKWDNDRKAVMKTVKLFKCSDCAEKKKLTCSCYEVPKKINNYKMVTSNLHQDLNYSQVKIDGEKMLIDAIKRQKSLHTASEDVLQSLFDSYWINRQETIKIVKNLRFGFAITVLQKNLESVSFDPVTVMMNQGVNENFAKKVLTWSKDQQLIKDFAIRFSIDKTVRNWKLSTLRACWQEFIGNLPKKPEHKLDYGLLIDKEFHGKKLNIGIFGLDYSGKRTLLEQLKLGPIKRATKCGIKVQTVCHANIRFQIIMIGSCSGHTFLNKLLEEIDCYIFISDSSEMRMCESQNLFRTLIGKIGIERPCVVMANMQDKPNAMKTMDVFNKMKKQKMMAQKFDAQGSCIIEGHGIPETLQCLAKLL